MILPKIEEWIKEIEQRPGLAIYRNVDASFLGSEGEEVESFQRRGGRTGAEGGGFNYKRFPMIRFKFLSISFLLVLLIFSACARSSSYGTATQTNPYSNFIGTIVAQTLTAFPSVPSQTATIPAQTPQDFISQYFDGINSRNYTLTWSLLSDRFKNTLNGPSQGGYQVYVDFWDSVKQVTVLDVTQTCQGNVCAVNVTMQLDYKNGQFDTSIYPYTLTYDQARNTWLFDLLPPAPVAQANPTATPASMLTTTPQSLPTRPEYKAGDLVDYVA